MTRVCVPTSKSDRLRDLHVELDLAVQGAYNVVRSGAWSTGSTMCAAKVSGSRSLLSAAEMRCLDLLAGSSTKKRYEAEVAAGLHEPKKKRKKAGASEASHCKSRDRCLGDDGMTEQC